MAELCFQIKSSKVIPKTKGLFLIMHLILFEPDTFCSHKHIHEDGENESSSPEFMQLHEEYHHLLKSVGKMKY